MNRPVSMRPVSAGILAGGAASRMGGQDKGWIEHRGRSLIERTLDAIRPQVSEVLVSANRNLERYRGLGYPVFTDDTADDYQGPLAGMVRLLEQASQPWLVCVPCDALEVPADLVDRFLQRVEETGADIAVLADIDGIHPTFCLMRTNLAADARACFERGERAPRRWFTRHKWIEVQGNAPGNINTPADLRALR